MGAIAVGFVAGIITLIAGQLAFALIPSLLIRAAVRLLFAIPAAVAGYYATLGLARIGVPSHGWREAFAIVGAILVGGTAWGRMALPADPLGTAKPSPPSSAQPLLMAARTES